MFDRVTLTVTDAAASWRFYELLLDDPGDELVLVAGEPVTRGLHLGFSAASHAAVDAFWRAGVDAGHASDGEPGPRPQYDDDCFKGAGNGSFSLVRGEPSRAVAFTVAGVDLTYG